MNKVMVTAIGATTNQEVEVELEGECVDISLNNGHLSVENEDGDLIALFAPGRWARGTVKEVEK